MNVDSAQIDQFNALASQWWNRQGEFKPLHDINPLRLQFMLDQVDVENKTIADIGCGGGILSESLAVIGAQVIGIDLADQALGVAKSHAAKVGVDVDYQCVDVESFAQKHAGQFDIVTCMEMLEHVPDPSSVIQACARLLKSNGWAFFSTINRNPKSFLTAIVGAEHILRMIPKGTHEYAQFIKPAELTQWCRGVGLTPKQIKGIHYNPLSKQYRLNDDCSVNYLLSTQK